MSFDLQLARRCLQFCERSYNEATVSDRLTDTQVLVADWGPDAGPCSPLVIAFRGSSSIRDFITDAEAWRKATAPGTGVAVHVGFLKAFTAVTDAVQNEIHRRASLSAGILPLVITGHSLGGALAILCAHYFYALGYRVESVYTFGQPRVGNGAFAAKYDAGLKLRTFRVVNQEDIVPRVPGVLAGYRHCGTEIFLPSGIAGRGLLGGSNPAFIENPSIWRKLVSDGVGFAEAFGSGGWKALAGEALTVALENHHINEYHARLGVAMVLGNSQSPIADSQHSGNEGEVLTTDSHR